MPKKLRELGTFFALGGCINSVDAGAKIGKCGLGFESGAGFGGKCTIEWRDARTFEGMKLDFQ